MNASFKSFEIGILFRIYIVKNLLIPRFIYSVFFLILLVLNNIMTKYELTKEFIILIAEHLQRHTEM